LALAEMLLVFVGAPIPRTGVANGHRERCKNLEKRKSLVS